MSGEPIILYENLLQSASSITGPAEIAGFEIANIHSGTTYDHWKPAASTGASLTIDLGSDREYVNSFAMAAYSVDVSDVYVQLRSSTDNFAASNDTEAQYSLYGHASFLIRLPAFVNRRYWRIQFASLSGASHTPIVGFAAIGQYLELPEGVAPPFTPPHMNSDDTILNSTGQTGALLGRSLIRNGNRGRLNVSLLDPSWIRGKWTPFHESAKTSPFMLDWSGGYYHNLLRETDNVHNTGVWQFSNCSSSGSYIIDPDGEHKLQTIDLTTSAALVRQPKVIPANDTGVFAVRFKCRLISGTLTSATVDIGDGTGVSFTPTATLDEFTLSVIGGGHLNGNLDFNFSFASGTPEIALTDVQMVRGSEQISYQKNTTRESEGAYCWTSKQDPVGTYSRTNYMDTQLDFNCLV